MILDWLKKIGERRKKRKAHNKLLIEATKLGDLGSVKKLLDLGANPNVYDEEGCSPLHIAVINADLAMIEALLKAKARVSIKTISHQGQEPLHIAAMGDRHNVIETLLTAGANIDRKSSDGRTPLIFAIQKGHRNTVVTLINAGANTSIGVKFGAFGQMATPAQFARAFKQKEIADLLDSIS